MYTHEWTTHEEAILKAQYEAGVDVREIARMLPRRTSFAVNRHALQKGLQRPAWYRPPRPNHSWDAIVEALDSACRPLEATEIADLTGLHPSLVYNRLNERHGKLVRIADWRVTTRKPAGKWVLGAGIDAPKPVKRKHTATDANPFAVALGLISAPSGAGRVIKQDMTCGEDVS